MRSLLGPYLHVEGYFPSRCRYGRIINELLIEGEENIHINLRLGFLERAVDSRPCFRLSSCLECEDGLTFVRDEFEETYHVSLGEDVFAHLIRPWSPMGLSQEMRSFSPLCEKGANINKFGRVFALTHSTECLSLNSCSRCVVAMEFIGGELLDLTRTGWDGDAGRRIRGGMGPL